MREIFIEITEDGYGKSWGTSWFSENCFPINVEEDHELFTSAGIREFRYVNQKLVKDQQALLEQNKEVTLRKFDQLCSETILGRFITEVDGVQYQFSCDNEAQKNFDKCLTAFSRGMIESNPWTAYTMEGEVVRLELTTDKFDKVYLSHLEHIQGNIAKFRDILEPRVREAKTLEELREITW